jgi:hypothetical protein
MIPEPDEDDDIWDSLFHGCAWAAFLDEAAALQGPPDSEATKRRAYRYYEEALAEKNRCKCQTALTAYPAPASREPDGDRAADALPGRCLFEPT